MPELEDAIQDEGIEDVSEVSEETADTEEQETVVSEREAAMERLASQRKQEIVEESGIEIDEPEKQEDEPEDDEEPEEIEDEEIEVEDEEPEEPEEKTVTLKVDGKDVEVPLSKIVDAGTRTLQKESTADKRLEEATRLLNEAKQTAQLPEKDVEEEKPKDALDKKKIAEAIQFGDEEEVEKAVSVILEQAEKNQQPAPTTEQLAQLVDQQVTIKGIQNELQKPYDPENEDTSGCSDLLANPYTHKALKDRVDQKVQQGTGNFFELDTYKEAAKEIRQEMKAIFGTPVTETKEKAKSDREKRVERKRKITTVKTASGKQLKQKKEEKPQTMEDKIAEMRKSRGQG